MSFIKRFRLSRQRGSEKQKQRSRGKATSRAELNIDEIKELMIQDSSPGAHKGLQRMEAYIERPVQRLLRNLLEAGPKAEIMPTYDLSFGFRYKDVEYVFGEETPFEKAEAFLERLSGLGILRKDFYDSISSCPACGSTSVTSHFRCSRCGSHQIVRSGLIEHIPCGSIDDRDKYYRGHVQPTCPKCGQPLVKGKYRDMGLWYVCRSCKERFEHPNLDLICRRCGNKFETQAVLVKEISKYSINAEMEQEIRQNVTSLESVNKLLTDLGFTVEESASAIGERSGIQHNFSMVAKKELFDREWIVAIDHAVAEDEVTASPLILYTYKLSEVKVDLPIFVAIPKLSEVAKRIANGYNILVIEGIPRENEDLSNLQEEIRRRLTERISKESSVKATDILPDESGEILERILKEGITIEVVRDKEGKFKKVQKA